ncbi:MAG TPA: methyltransferase domain-containing protein [Candidatus Dormibacteraeota bacterium]|nr:methyltransferase domain-containing protein [Candidatus Dormibacteraeota bacterium]
MRFFALTVPGLGPLLRDELADQLDGSAVGDVEHDGRSDVVPFTAGPAEPVVTSLAEDVFVELGTGDPAAPLPRLAGQLWSARRYDEALPAAAGLGRLGPRPGFRVVARLRSERGFLRTELRDELTRAVLRERPRWRPADPAPVELWALHTRPRRIRLGLRLSDRRMRQRDGREVERPGALRPVVAAAMLRLASPIRGAVLDPCCGTGTIVAESLATGGRAIGADLDAAALAAARVNLPPGTPLLRADAAALPLPAASTGSVVTNLPFGRRHALPADPAPWLRAAFAEFERVVVRGGAIVLLQPRSPAFQAAVLRPRASLLRSRHPIELLGQRTTIWVFVTRPSSLS